MKHEAFIQYGEGSGLKGKVSEWISENEDKISEIVDIEYKQEGNIFFVTIAYIEK